MKLNAKVMKPLLLVAAAIMLVVATVFATMAYMTSSAAVSNVFTVGNVKLHMFESRVDKDGNVLPEVGENGMKPADTNSYHLVPGASYTKNPTIYVDGGSDNSYLYVRLRNDLKTIELQNDPEHPTILQQLQKNGWLEIERAESNVDAVFVYVGEDVTGITAQQYFESGKKVPTVGGVADRVEYDVFETFTLAEKIDNLAIFGGARVAIVAYAIQARLPDYDTSETIGTEAAIKMGWEYIKQELPFVV